MNQIDKNQFETRNELKDWYNIILHKEGNFFRAYNQSAYIISSFVYKPENPSHSIKISKYNTKQGGDFIVLGFPISSTEKFLPNLSVNATTKENVFVASIKPDCIDARYRNHDILTAEFEKLFKSTPITENTKSKSNSKDEKKQEPADIFTLMRLISKYDLENKTPIEALTFISQLKILVNKIL